MSRAVQWFLDRSSPEPNSGCWLWLNAIGKHGYGVLNINGRMARAHREAFKAAKGEPPPGLDVCHRCDVRCCVNPDHLFPGTRTDNMRDCANKGRIVLPELRGTELPQSKLTPAQVLEIRASSQSQRALGRLYSVDKGTIAHIVHRKTWKHL
ncbi:HNH endonuclease signature motif containing protein [Bradyrhizobium sp.]|uniref:HNH endonuclease signature motif containing protein n=1 Tax=Bradyrhizobium sp. TaxID=376 RepID=UPI003C4CFDC0